MPWFRLTSARSAPAWTSVVVRRVAALGLLGAVSWSRPAAADAARAEELFREARRLLANGQDAEACDMFAESQREDPSSGALLNLARCHVEAGMTATAWSEYLAAARLARLQERTQQAAEAELRAAELQPRLTYLLVRLEAPSSDVVVSRDGEVIPTSDLGKPIPIDPGRHTIRAKAATGLEWAATVLVAQPGQVRTVSIPALSPTTAGAQGATAQGEPPGPSPSASNAPAPRAAPATRSRSAASTGRVPVDTSKPAVPTASWVVAGIGGAALVSSGVLAWLARYRWNEAHDRGWCDQEDVCSSEGMRATDQARELGNLATAGLALGAASLASSAVIYLVSRSNDRPAARIAVALSPGAGGVAVQGDF